MAVGGVAVAVGGGAVRSVAVAIRLVFEGVAQVLGWCSWHWGASAVALLPGMPCSAHLLLLVLPAGLPKGVLNIVHGTHDTVNRILDHPDIAAISFVGSGGWAGWVGGWAGRQAGGQMATV